MEGRSSEESEIEYALSLSRLGVDEDVRPAPSSATLNAFLFDALGRHDSQLADNVYAITRQMINNDTENPDSADLATDFVRWDDANTAPGAYRLGNIRRQEPEARRGERMIPGKTTNLISEFSWWAYQMKKRKSGSAAEMRRLITGHPMFSEADNEIYMGELTKFTSSDAEGGYIDGEVNVFKLLSKIQEFENVFGKGLNRMSQEPGLAELIRDCTQRALREFGDDAMAAFRVAEILKEHHPEDWDEICDFMESLSSSDEILSDASLKFLTGIYRNSDK